MKYRAVLAALLTATLVEVASAAAAPSSDVPLCAEGWDIMTPEDVPPDVLNLTLAEFEQQFIPSEANPDDGNRLVWVPCDQLEVQVEAACQQLEAGEVAAFQLHVALNCTHEAPVPHSDLASFAANVTLVADNLEASIFDAIIDLDGSHTALPCIDTLCALCATDPNTCDLCQPEHGPDPATGACAPLPAAAEAAPSSDAPAAVGSSTGPARGTAKACPQGQYWVGWEANGKAVCLDCHRSGCNDCAACDPAVYGRAFCWNGQYCVPPPSGGRPCLDGYFFSNGGCALCRVAIPNCAFCNACKPGSPKCLGGARCVQCSPSFKLGARGYCPKA